MDFRTTKRSPHSGRAGQDPSNESIRGRRPLSTAPPCTSTRAQGGAATASAVLTNVNSRRPWTNSPNRGGRGRPHGRPLADSRLPGHVPEPELRQDPGGSRELGQAGMSHSNMIQTHNHFSAFQHTKVIRDRGGVACRTRGLQRLSTS